MGLTVTRIDRSEVTITSEGTTAREWYNVVADGDDVPLGAGDVIGATGLPEVGTTAHPEIPAITCSNVLIRRVRGHTDLAEVEAQFGGPPGGGGGPNVGTVTRQTETRGRFDQWWRSPTFNPAPVDGTVSNDNTDDIGGQMNDHNGHPMHWIRQQQALIITEIIFDTSLNVPLHNSFVGTRNSTVFEGFIKGQLVYIGSRASPVTSDVFSVSHQFLGDNIFHLVQVPARNQLGKVVTVPGGLSPSGIQIYNAFEVYWRQPYPFFNDFAQLGVFF